jgi:pimeloyl-ACP methyl ester carboxylesterase
MDITIGSVTSPDGTHIEYETSGSGTPLVLAAGALGTKGSAWQRGFAAEFAKTFRVYSYDRRGRGGSSDTRPYTIEREVEDLQAVCAAAGGDPVVVGMSSGATLVLEAAASGVPMRAAVAFEPPYMVGAHRRPNHARYESEVSTLVARDDRDGAVKLFMCTVGVPGFALFIMRLLPMWKQLIEVAHTLPYDAAIMRGFELPGSRLSAIGTPTLVVGGGRSPASLKDAARSVAHAIPGSRFVEIPKQSHNIKPSALAPVVREFAESVVLQPA